MTLHHTNLQSVQTFHLSPSLFPVKLSLLPPLVPVHPNPTPEVKPYSWINLAGVWPNVHWHTSPHLSLSHTVCLPYSPFSQEASCTDRWSALTFYNNKLLALFATLALCFLLQLPLYKLKVQLLHYRHLWSWKDTSGDCDIIWNLMA